ncbi:MAG: IMP dehydrogenase [Candidatus Marinimicrobia bacterium]|nr:IMP dehydrogenase [Candidatus Neomarinimicrobiota bacterium]
MKKSQSYREGLTFDDVLLIPKASDVLPIEVDVSTNLTRKIQLRIPIISAAMDTVTQSEMAIALAKEGGMGILHKNMTIEQQADQVILVKKEEVDTESFPKAVVDEKNKLRVGVAIGITEDVLERSAALLEAGADVLVLDSAHGHSKGVLETVKKIRLAFSSAQLIAGNVATGEGAAALIETGVDAIKVGIGSGASCTTRIVAGTGVPQLTAVIDCALAARESGIPVISDGGLRYSGDIAKSIAAGAGCVMLGRLLAGLDESPGELITLDGKPYKSYRGMGSIGPMWEQSADRYFQEKDTKKKLVPEGIEGAVPYQGRLTDTLYQMIGGLRAAMGYCGAHNIQEMQTITEFIRVTASGKIENHPHDIKMIKNAPNYRGKDVL